MMLPTIIRRPLTITAWLVMSIVSLIFSPLLLAAGTLAARFRPTARSRDCSRTCSSPTARASFGVIVAAGALWLASGCGVAMHRPRIKRAHYRLLRWYVRGLAERVLALLDLDVAPELPPESRPPSRPTARSSSSAVTPGRATPCC